MSAANAAPENTAKTEHARSIFFIECPNLRECRNCAVTNVNRFYHTIYVTYYFIAVPRSGPQKLRCIAASGQHCSCYADGGSSPDAELGAGSISPDWKSAFGGIGGAGKSWTLSAALRPRLCAVPAAPARGSPLSSPGPAA